MHHFLLSFSLLFFSLSLQVDEVIAEAMAKIYRKAVFGFTRMPKTASEVDSDDASLVSG